MSHACNARDMDLRETISMERVSFEYRPGGQSSCASLGRQGHRIYLFLIVGCDRYRRATNSSSTIFRNRPGASYCSKVLANRAAITPYSG
jgi:hypothetical protein